MGEAVARVALWEEMVQNPVLRMPVLLQSSFSPARHFHSSCTFLFLRTCEVTREQEQSGAKTLGPALIRHGL